MTTAYNSGPFSVERKRLSIVLHQPSLEEVQWVLYNVLEKVFEEVSVRVVRCPDLTIEPFSLTGSGLCGNTMIMQLGGISNLYSINSEHTWNLRDVLDQMHIEHSFVIGGGVQCGTINHELIADFTYSQEYGLKNQSMLAYVNKVRECEMKFLNNDTYMKCDLLGNFFISNGKTENVLEVRVTKNCRTNVNFTEIMQVALREKYGNICPVWAAIFFMQEGRVKQTVISRTPQDVSHEYELHSPLIGVGTIFSLNSISSQTSLKRYIFRDKNFYVYSKNKHMGGYYRDCLVPYRTQYYGYFNVANKLYFVDVPTLYS